MKGYKGMSEDMTCLGMHYEVGKSYHVDGEIALCHNGIHFCERIKDVFEFYRENSANRFFEVDASGVIVSDGTKSAASDLTILRELTEEELFRCIYGDGCGESRDINGNGYGNGHGDGYGYRSGYGDGHGNGDRNGNRKGNGHGDGDGDSNGKGNGYGYGYGNGHGDGYGYGYDYGCNAQKIMAFIERGGVNEMRVMSVCVICECGWILKGIKDEVSNDNVMTLHEASVVRRWSNGKGIGGIAKEANKEEYKLDYIGDVNIRQNKVLFEIPCEW